MHGSTGVPHPSSLLYDPCPFLPPDPLETLGCPMHCDIPRQVSGLPRTLESQETCSAGVSGSRSHDRDVTNMREELVALVAGMASR